MTTVQDEKNRIDYLLQRDKITDKEIQKAYDDGLYKLKAVINSAFSLYSTDGVLVPTNLNRKVTKKDMLLLKEQFDKLPSDLELPEQSRVDYYLAMSQTSVSKLISATLGIALIGITMKLGKILRKNNKTAVLEEYRYQTERLDLTPKQAKKVRDKKKEIAKDDYVFSDEKAKEYVPWLDRLWLNHDQTLNRIDNSINEMLKQGMRAQDIAEKMFPENAESMRKDNIPKAIREASNNVKRLARTEAARREDEMAEATFQASGVKQIKFVNEPGACKKCIPLQGGYPLDESPRIPKDTHPNCRCRRIPHIESEDEEKSDSAKRKAFLAGTVSVKSNKSEDNDNSDDELDNVDDLEEEINYNEDGDDEWKTSKFATKKAFSGHYEKHGKEIGAVTKEEFLEIATDLLSSPTSEFIWGYKTDTRYVRYDVKNNIYVLGNPKIMTIKTIFKPDDKEEYYYDQVRKDLDKR